MSIYFVLIILISILTFTSGNKNKKIFLSFILLFTIAALRSKFIGTDLENYINEFQNPTNDSRHEYGYKLFSTIIYLISNNAQFYIVCISFLTLFPIYWIAKHEINEYKGSFVFLIYILCDGYLFSFSGIRQSIAISFTILSLYLFTKNKFTFSLICYLFAVSFHNSAITILPIVGVSLISTIDTKIKYILLFSTFAIGILDLSIFDKINSSINIFQIKNFSEYKNYQDVSYIENYTYNLNGILFTIVPQTIIGCILLLQSKNKNSFLINIFIYSICLSNLFVSSPLIQRVFKYGLTLSILLIPQYYNSYDKKNKYLTWTMLIILVIVFIKTLFNLYFRFTNEKINSSVPYYFFWEQ